MVEETFREFKTVRQHGKWIVSPWWLQHSKDGSQRLSEGQYPHTFANTTVSSNPTTPKIIEPSPQAAKPMTVPVSPSSIDFDSLLAVERRPNRPTISYDLSASVKPREEPVVKRVFALSGLTNDQRARFTRILNGFPGIEDIRASSSWDPSATHLIIGNLTKSEKFLAACAAGIWYLLLF